jgi:UDP-2,4-diacetamido-2,4,6-trideoxy-beta-L-altropyranose hydrolase
VASQKKVAFRVDASSDIGSGHLMRCLTLAKSLKEAGFYVLFICRNIPMHLQILVQANYNLKILKEDGNHSLIGTLAHSSWLCVSQEKDLDDSVKALQNHVWDWVVVDHYAIDHTWESKIKKNGLVKNILVIDDLADRKHFCDVLLDQNLGREYGDYAGLVTADCTLLVGPLYALVRKEFIALRESSLLRRKSYKLKNILITMGGVDSLNISGQLIEALSRCMLPKDIAVTIVMGQSANCLSEVRLAVERSSLNARIVINAKNMGELMLEADLCIGAAGSTSWERCTLGLPAIVFCIADNQRSVVDALSKSGVALTMQLNGNSIDPVALSNKIAEASSLSYEMTEKSAAITDGEGARRVSFYLYR